MIIFLEEDEILKTILLLPGEIEYASLSEDNQMFLEYKYGDLYFCGRFNVSASPPLIYACPLFLCNFTKAKDPTTSSVDFNLKNLSSDANLRIPISSLLGRIITT
jgi:hypothetical protein